MTAQPSEKLTKAEVEEILLSPNDHATYPPFPSGGRWTHFAFCMHAEVCNSDEYWQQCDFSFCVCWNPTKRLAQSWLEQYKALEQVREKLDGMDFGEANYHISDVRELIDKVLP